MRKLTAILTALLLLPVVSALAKTSHKGWPRINGLRVINQQDANRTIRGVPDKHNELLGGDGSDTIYGGNAGDVIWGDYKPHAQPTGQVDRINAGDGNDFIYASHGTNYISTGAGADVVHAHFGRGEIHCGSPQDVVYLSHMSKRGYKLFGCRHVSFATLGY